MITIQIHGHPDDAQRAEHLIRPLFNVISSVQPLDTGSAHLREIQVEFIPPHLLEWQCPLCGEDIPDRDKVGHLMASHNAYREKWTDWNLNDDVQNTRRLKDLWNQMNVFQIRHETRPEALYAGVRNMVERAQKVIEEAIKYYQEGK